MATGTGWMFFLKIVDDPDQELEITRDDYRSPIPERFQWRNWAAAAASATNLATANITTLCMVKELRKSNARKLVMP